MITRNYISNKFFQNPFAPVTDNMLEITEYEAMWNQNLTQNGVKDNRINIMGQEMDVSDKHQTRTRFVKNLSLFSLQYGNKMVKKY